MWIEVKNKYYSQFMHYHVKRNNRNDTIVFSSQNDCKSRATDKIYIHISVFMASVYPTCVKNG